MIPGSQVSSPVTALKKAVFISFLFFPEGVCLGVCVWGGGGSGPLDTPSL